MISIDLVMASLGEETRASCRGPSNHNAIALILPHKGMLGFTVERSALTFIATASASTRARLQIARAF